MEKYATKCKKQNYMSKLSHDLHFVFWTLGLRQAFYYLLFIKVYKDRNLKNWVEDVIIFSVSLSLMYWILRKWKICSVQILPL